MHHHINMISQYYAKHDLSPVINIKCKKILLGYIYLIKWRKKAHFHPPKPLLIAPNEYKLLLRKIRQKVTF